MRNLVEIVMPMGNRDEKDANDHLSEIKAIEEIEGGDKHPSSGTKRNPQSFSVEDYHAHGIQWATEVMITYFLFTVFSYSLIDNLGFGVMIWIFLLSIGLIFFLSMRLFKHVAAMASSRS